MRFLGVFLTLILLAAPAQAQLFPYNPYAETQFESPEEAAAAAKKWPPFFKKPPIDAKHQFYYMMGWCKPKPWHYKFDPADLVDVQKLPESSFQGKVVVAGQGLIGGLDQNESQVCVMIHPHPEVSRVHVVGRATVLGLKPGMFVRLQGQPDSAGHIADKLARLEVISVPADYKFDEVTPGERQTIVGKISGMREGKVTLAVSAGKIRRVTAELTDEPEITVDVNDYSLAAAGDEATAKGRLYKPAETAGLSQLFASEVEIKLSEPLGKKRK